MNVDATKFKINDESQRARLKLSRAVDSDLIIYGRNERKLFPYQNASVEYALSCKDATLFADPPGVGKTIQAIGYINFKRIRKTLIVCPATLVFNWMEELYKWLQADLKISIYHPNSFAKDTDILIASYYWFSNTNKAREVVSRFKYDHIIIDEVHYLKNDKAQRTKILLANNGVAKRASTIHALSGTPIVNRPIELYPIVKALSPESINNMNKFEYGIHFCGGKKTHFGWDFTGASRLPLLGQMLRSNFMIRRKKEDVLKQLPVKFQPMIIYLKENSDSKSAVNSLSVFDNDLKTNKYEAIDFTKMSSARKELGVSKTKSAIEYIKEQLESGHEKIIVFAHHSEVIKILEKGLESYGVVTLTGKMDAGKKQHSVNSFQNDKNKRIFIGSVEAAGTGITLTAASYVIFVEFSYVPGVNEQCEDRASRIGQTKGVMIEYLVFKESLEERILEILIEKRENISGFIT